MKKSQSHAGTSFFINSLFRKHHLAKFGSSMKQKSFIFTIFNIWGWCATLFTIIKELGISEVDWVQRLVPKGCA